MISLRLFRLGLAVALATASLVLSSFAQSNSPSLVWTKRDGKDLVRLQGLPEGALSKFGALTTEEWQKIFPVTVENKDLIAAVERPAMLGNYAAKDGTIEFTPTYPLVAPLKYRATFHIAKLTGQADQPAMLSAVYEVKAPVLTPTTIVQQIYPTADVLPENLLKFYLYFSAPMSGGQIYEHIHLFGPDGKAVQLPFLEIDEELWNKDMTRLTLFIDPGRIKRGVKPLEDIGPALEAGKSYTLQIDHQWLDGQGAPLKADFKKTFKVSAPNREPMDIKDWKLTVPKASSSDSLKVQFPRPIDQALAQRMIWITDAQGNYWEGQIKLSVQETRWEFIPDKPWTKGKYQLTVQTTIEDLSGNNIEKPFEVDLFDKVQKKITHKTVSLPFTVK